MRCVGAQQPPCTRCAKSGRDCIVQSTSHGSSRPRVSNERQLPVHTMREPGPYQDHSFGQVVSAQNADPSQSDVSRNSIHSSQAINQQGKRSHRYEEQAATVYTDQNDSTIRGQTMVSSSTFPELGPQQPSEISFTPGMDSNSASLPSVYSVSAREMISHHHRA